jgi:hypothetical protein
MVGGTGIAAFKVVGCGIESLGVGAVVVVGLLEGM